MTISRKIAQDSSGQQAELQLVGSGFDAALGVDFIFNILGFLCMVRDGMG